MSVTDDYLLLASETNDFKYKTFETMAVVQTFMQLTDVVQFF